MHGESFQPMPEGAKEKATPVRPEQVAKRERTLADRFSGYKREMAAALAALTMGISGVASAESRHGSDVREPAVAAKAGIGEGRAGDINERGVTADRLKEVKRQAEAFKITRSQDAEKAMVEQGIELKKNKITFPRGSTQELLFDAEINGVKTVEVTITAGKDSDGSSILYLVCKNSDGSKDMVDVKGGEIINMGSITGK